MLAYVLLTRGEQVERWRLAAFGTGCLLLLAAVTPVEALSYHLLSMHLLQNVVLAEWAPALLVAGIPPSVAERLARVPAVRLLTRPPVALGLWLLVYFAWHLPPVYDAALVHPATLLHLEHAMYLGAGALLWWPVLQDAASPLERGPSALPVPRIHSREPDRAAPGAGARAAYDYYVEGGGLWGLGAHADQQLAGVTMAMEQAIVFFAVFTIFFFRFLADEKVQSPAGTK